MYNPYQELSDLVKAIAGNDERKKKAIADYSEAVEKYNDLRDLQRDHWNYYSKLQRLLQHKSDGNNDKFDKICLAIKNQNKLVEDLAIQMKEIFGQ